jgi:hypothetical protein
VAFSQILLPTGAEQDDERDGDDQKGVCDGGAPTPSLCDDASAFQGVTDGAKQKNGRGDLQG